MSTLCVTVVRAKNLVAADKGGTSDPYVKLRLGSTTQKTHVVKKCLNPTWKESFRFTIDNPTAHKLRVEVFDKDRWTRDDPIGNLEIPLNLLERGKKTTEWYRLEQANSGQVQLTLQALDFGLAEGQAEIKSMGDASAYQSNYGTPGSAQYQSQGLDSYPSQAAAYPSAGGQGYPSAASSGYPAPAQPAAAQGYPTQGYPSTAPSGYPDQGSYGSGSRQAPDAGGASVPAYASVPPSNGGGYMGTSAQNPPSGSAALPSYMTFRQ